MKYFALILLACGMAMFTGCNNSKSEDATTEATNPAVNSAPATVQGSTPDSAMKINNTTTNPDVPKLNTPTTTISTGKGLNPEHGKPGHRCDIPVGASLDSKPTPAAATTTIPATGSKPTAPIIPVTTQAQPAANTTVTTGLNPEHGKPGHRCDIAVGAPLNSKPAASTVTTQPATSITPVMQQPAPMTPTLPTSNSATGLNPEHGKPGHRCDIAVGAPLNSKPKQ